MKFQDVPRGIPCCCGDEPHVFARLSVQRGGIEFLSDMVMIMGTGAVVHISKLTGKNCLERDDYHEPGI